MDDLKQKTTKSFIWNFLDKVGYQVIALIVGIFTLRLLDPQDFGYTGALAVFTALSNILVESGFTAAFVRRERNTKEEYTAAFLFNLMLSMVLYMILYVSAGAIADYYKMDPLKDLARVIFLAIIINSFTIVQTVILTKELSFKKLTIANLSGMVVSAVITLWMAATGWGYWALAAQQISQVVVKAIILWSLSNWRPVKIKWSDFRVIKEVLSFSALLILSSTITNVVKYIYNVYIGPRYTSDDLGYYAQANKFHQIPLNVISSSITGVAYPVLTSLNNEAERQMTYMHKILKMTAFITFPIVAGLYGISENFVHVIITDKWLPMLPYFRVMLIGGVALPFINLYINMFNVFGKPKLYFATEFARNALIIILLLLFNESIMQILAGYIIACYAALLGTVVLISKVCKYGILKQLAHTLPSCLIALAMGAAVYFVPTVLDMPYWAELLIQIALGGAIYAGLAKLFRMQIMDDLIATIIKKR